MIKIKNYELNLPYYKQGDDLRDHLNEHPDDHAAALQAHVDRLMEAVKILQKLTTCVPTGLHVDAADTHYISVTCPEELGDRLVAEGLLYPEDDSEEDNERS